MGWLMVAQMTVLAGLGIWLGALRAFTYNSQKARSFVFLDVPAKSGKQPVRWRFANGPAYNAQVDVYVN